MSDMPLITDRFSFDEFNQLGRNSKPSDRLADELCHIIAAEMATPLLDLADRVANKLNKLGHNCRLQGLEISKDGAVEITFADDSRGDDHCLRFNFDLVISSGFPGYRLPGDI